MSEHYKFFQNKECEYFPCHKVKEAEDFNCLFCYCPLYLKEECGETLLIRKQASKIVPIVCFRISEKTMRKC